MEALDSAVYVLSQSLLEESLKDHPDEEKHEFTIELESSDVTGGQLLKGTVNLTLNYSLPCRGVRVHLSGHELAYWSVGTDGRFGRCCCCVVCLEANVSCTCRPAAEQARFTAICARCWTRRVC